MADRKISDLTALTTPAAGDYLPIVDVSEPAASNKNKRITIEELLRGAPDGTAAAPGIGFESDPNTGIYSPGADQVAISTNGTQRVTVDTAATTSTLPVVHPLGAVGTPSITFTGDLNTGFWSPAADTVAASTGGSERLRITSAGLVGIGISSPVHTIDVAGTGRHFSTTTDGASLYLSKTNSGTADQGGNKVYFTNAGPAATGRASGTLIGALQFQASQPSSGSLVNCGAIEVTADGTQSGVFTPTKLQISTSDTVFGGNRVAMTIDASQRVGIGTTSPNELLEVAGNIHLSGADRSIFNRSNNALTFGTNNAERARIDSSGRLLVGTSTAQGNNLLQVQQSGGGFISLRRDEAATAITAGEDLGAIQFQDNGGNVYAEILAEADATAGSGDYPGRLVFSTTADGASSPTERMRLRNNGELWIHSTGGDPQFLITNSVAAGTSLRLISGRYSGGTIGTGTESFRVYTNGNVENTNNSYGAISDIKLKENIVDANSQWSDIKALQVRNYNFKEGQTHTQIGLVAQEVELVSPGLVTESPDHDEEGNDLGTVTKSVNYSVLYMKAVKALQEAMERIETLEAKVAALETA